MLAARPRFLIYVLILATFPTSHLWSSFGAHANTTRHRGRAPQADRVSSQAEGIEAYDNHMSPSTTSLPEAGEIHATREAIYYLEPEEDKQIVEFNDQTTGPSSTIDGETEKQLLPEDSGPTTKEEAVVVASAPQDSEDHATGVKLLFIVIALVLSIFLFSLDQVSSTAPISRAVVSCQSITRRYADFPEFRPSLQPPF
jgi:hypothetical protein